MNSNSALPLLKDKFYIYLIAIIIAGSSIIFLAGCSSNDVKSTEGKTDAVVNENVNKAPQQEKIVETPKTENTVIEKPIELNDKNFKSTIKTGIVLVDFWATWCAPCRQQGPIIDELTKEFDGKVKIGKLNVDANNNIASEYNVKNIPTIIIFKDGKQALRFVGLQEKEFLKTQIKGLL